MGFRYAVVGAGRQGVSAAYDMARFGDADSVLLIDADESAARSGAQRINELVGEPIVKGSRGDASKPDEMRGLLDGVEAFLSAVPYPFNPLLTDVALEVGASMCDLGGNTDVTRSQLSMDEAARAAGISIVPDCGMGPGLNISLGVYAMSLLEEPRELYIYDGGLPQHPEPPWNYALTFHIGGLINEYAGEVAFLRDCEVVSVPALSAIESFDLPEVGIVEAAVTTGGLSTMPWSFKGRLQALENKTLRYPGHWALMQAYQELGLFSLDPVVVKGQPVVPRDLFAALLAPQIAQPDVRDVCIIYVVCRGLDGGEAAEATVSLVDYYDEQTGFSAMERLTGWHASIVAILAARGDIPRGAVPIELALPGDVAVVEMRARGLNTREKVRLL